MFICDIGWQFETFSYKELKNSLQQSRLQQLTVVLIWFEVDIGLEGYVSLGPTESAPVTLRLVSSCQSRWHGYREDQTPWDKHRWCQGLRHRCDSSWAPGCRLRAFCRYHRYSKKVLAVMDFPRSCRQWQRQKTSSQGISKYSPKSTGCDVHSLCHLVFILGMCSAKLVSQANIGSSEACGFGL